MDEITVFFSCGVAGENRKDSQCERYAEDSKRKTLEIIREVENCKASRSKSRGDNCDNKKINLCDGKTHCSGNHEFQNFSEVLVFEIKGEPKTETADSNGR